MGRNAFSFQVVTKVAHPIVGPDDFEQLVLPDRYDLIWVGSLFTHLDQPRFESLLRCLERALDPGRVLLFTVAGRHVAGMFAAGEIPNRLSDEEKSRLLSDFERNGFGYSRYPGFTEYEFGRTYVRPSWVLSVIERQTSLRPVLYAEKGSVNRQDAVACVAQ